MVGTKEAEDCFADEADPIYSDGGVFVVEEFNRFRRFGTEIYQFIYYILKVY